MPTEMVFEVEGLTELQQTMNRGPVETRIALNEGLREIGRALVPAKGTGPLAENTPRRGGKLARSTFFEIHGSGTEDQLLVVLQPARSPAKYGAHFYGMFVREGTRPHKISARLAKSLRWVSNGDVFFAKSVNHPGTKPNPYHIRTLQQQGPVIQEIVNRMGNKVTAFFGGR